MDILQRQTWQIRESFYHARELERDTRLGRGLGSNTMVVVGVGIGVGEHTMNVSMVANSRGIHVVGYNLLAIKKYRLVIT